MDFHKIDKGIEVRPRASVFTNEQPRRGVIDLPVEAWF